MEYAPAVGWEDEKPTEPGVSGGEEISENDLRIKECVDEAGRRVIRRVNERSFFCCLCNVEFKQKSQCIKHIAEAHSIKVREIRRKPPDGTVFSCEYCDKWFINRTNVYRHIRSHHPDKKQPQAVSGKAYQEACPICNENFASLNGVNRHIRVHKIDLDAQNQASGSLVSCHFCDMKFPQESSCLNHMGNYHHAILIPDIGGGDNVKTFQCSLCYRLLHKQSDLKEHLLDVHGVNLREYLIEERNLRRAISNCKGCNLSFKDDDSWRFHMKEVHKATPESCCRKCGISSLKTIHELKLHLNDVHGIPVKNESLKKKIVRPKRQIHHSQLGLKTKQLRALEKIPHWLVKHGEGQLLVVVHK